ncbi:MAG: hypothetical protein CVV27_05625 [Candidatus Melainabacteria bacterium HGW-Melainabacteria-1]|nr:MAG: hypothetical protein CVV27_05625 [Candidatus Melainabacteria bacterium HGW-Melainabacteria-1]
MLNSLQRISMVLTVALLTGCLAPQAREADQRNAEAMAAVERIVNVIVSRRRDQISEMASLPFWSDRWITNQQELQAEFRANPDQTIQAKQLALRVYPLADLAALHPEAWAQIRSAEPAWLEQLYIGAIALEVDGSTESGLLLLRKVDGRWTLAGILDN